MSQAAATHTILLIQANKNADSRTWTDFETVADALEGICKMYEEHLKRENPKCKSITYDIAQLFDFLDQLQDISCVVGMGDSNRYSAHGRDWLKEKIYLLLRREAHMQ